MLTVMEEECMCSKLKIECQQQNLTLSQVSGSLCPLCARICFYLSELKKNTVWNRMTASILKQDPNTKRFKQMLIYFNPDTQYANFWGNPLYQATKWHLNNKQ